MCRCKYGNPKKKSQFICLRCLNINQLGNGIQRSNQREKFHVKDLTCILCGGIVTKNLEIRYCDWVEEIKNQAEKLHMEYYEKEGCLCES